MSQACDGHLDCLTSRHEQGCPWDGSEVATAACGGHVDCLKYALDNGASWSDDCVARVVRWHYGCVGYTYDSRLSSTRWEVFYAGYASCNHLECLQLILSRPRSPTADTRNIEWVRRTVNDATERKRAATLIQRAWRAAIDMKRRNEDAYIACGDHVR